MALIDKLTDLTSFDYDKVGKTNTMDGRFEVNRQEKQEGGRVESLDDLPRPNIDRNTLPPLVKGVVQATETAVDVSTTQKGILFKAKQAILHTQNASPDTRVYDPTALEKSLVKNDNNFVEVGEEFGSEAPEGSALEDAIKKVAPSPDSNVKTPDSNVSQKLSYDVPGGDTILGIQRFNDFDKRPSRRIGVNFLGQDVSKGLSKDLISNSDDKNIYKDNDFIKFYVNDPINKRIIQFPAYLNDITDNSGGEYNGTRYIGRADQVFVYSGYSRNISFSFRVAALTRGDIPMMWKKIEALKSLTLPKYQKIFTEQTAKSPVAPFVELTIGDLYVNQPGYFTSVGLTIPQNSNWEIEDGYQLTHLCDVSLEYTFIGKELPSIDSKQFDMDGYDKDFEEGKQKELERQGAILV
jgi:hypothetical protein